MLFYRCPDCGLGFNETDESCEIAVKTGCCPRCAEPLKNFPSSDSENPSFINEIVGFSESTSGLELPDDLDLIETSNEHKYHTANDSIKLSVIKLLWLLFSLDGRIGRGMYLISIILTYGFISFVYYLVYSFFDSEGSAFNVSFILCIWCFLSQSLKRLHDFGGSVWTLLILIILSIFKLGVFCLIYIIFNGGTNGANKYGEGRGWENRPK